FLHCAGALAGSTLLRAEDVPPLNPLDLAKFVDPLPIPPLTASSGLRSVPGYSSRKARFYRVAMRKMHVKVHRDLAPTRVWSYGSSWPGPTFETRKGEGVLVEWANELPPKHFLPIDHHLHGAEESNPEVRAVVHVHGARVPPESDGFPEDWYAP